MHILVFGLRCLDTEAPENKKVLSVAFLLFKAQERLPQLISPHSSFFVFIRPKKSLKY